MTIKIMLDPGHGGSDPGAIGNGLNEKDLNLDIAKRTKAYLDNNYGGHQTQLTRDRDSTLSLKARTDKANRCGANYLLSIHINAHTGQATGYEDFIFNGAVQATTVRLRDVIHEYTSDAVKWSNRGKKKANFHMLRESRMPAMLTENGFIDNKTDAAKLKDDKEIQRIAEAHAKGLASAFRLPKAPPKPSTPKKMYKVQVGAFTKKENAEKRARQLRADGYSTYIVYE